MNKTILIFLIITASLLLSVFLRNMALDRISRQLYQAAYVDKDTVLFESLIDSLPAQMFISERSRKIMALNYYVSANDKDKVIRTCKEMNGKRLTAMSSGHFTGLPSAIFATGKIRMRGFCCRR